MIKWKDILHVLNTWLVANLLHPLFLIILWGKMDGEWFNDGYTGLYFFCLMYSFLFSFPLLVIAIVLFILISKTKISSLSKFGSWTFFVITLPIIVWIFSIAQGSGEIYSEHLETLIPAPLSVLIAVVIRYRQFFHRIRPIAIIKTNDNG